MDWSYVAGYFDGEGHVGLHRQTRDHKGTGGRICTLNWYNSHLGSLEAIRDFMGVGYINERGHQTRNRMVYALVISRRRDLLYALDQMIPHLIVKREAAEGLRDYLAHRRDQSEGFGNAVAATTEQLTQWYDDEGKSYAEIGKLLGVGASAIAREFRVRGLKARPSGGAFMKGVAKSEETKQRMKASRRKMWEDPEFRTRQLENLKLGRNRTTPGA